MPELVVCSSVVNVPRVRIGNVRSKAHRLARHLPHNLANSYELQRGLNMEMEELRIKYDEEIDKQMSTWPRKKSCSSMPQLSSTRLLVRGDRLSPLQSVQF